MAESMVFEVKEIDADRPTLAFRSREQVQVGDVVEGRYFDGWAGCMRKVTGEVVKLGSKYKGKVRYIDRIVERAS